MQQPSQPIHLAEFSAVGCESCNQRKHGRWRAQHDLLAVSHLMNSKPFAYFICGARMMRQGMTLTNRCASAAAQRRRCSPVR
eukprot:6190692-Pleurochrysis_carterae.AAC.3